MRPRRDPVPRAKEAWVWLGGLLLLGLLGAGVTVAAVLLWENIDIRQLTPGLVATTGSIPEPQPPSPPAVADIPFEAVLFVSPTNATFFDDRTYYQGEMDRWRKLTAEVGGQVRVASTADDLRQVGPHELLLVPEAPCLAPAELAAVNRHVRTGGSLITNWAVGVRDGECGWRGWETLLDLTDAEEVQELPPREALYLTVPAGLAVSAGIDPGTRIELRPDPSLALRMSGPQAYWSDWALNPAPDPEGAGADVAVSTRKTEAGGRIAWFGVRVGQAATPRDSLLVQRLVENGILWAAGVPTAAPTPWPDAARAALVFTLDVEAEQRNAMDMAAMLESEGLTATFFAVSQIVQEDAELARTLAAVGEVGTQTSDHTPVAGLTRQEQNLRLRRAASDIQRWTGVPPKGLHPPEEAFDAATLAAWQSVGGTYLIGGNEARSGSPEVHLVPGGSVLLLPRVLKDDYNVIVQDGTIRAQRLADAFLAGARKMRAIGGLAVMAGHTQIMLPGRRLDAVRIVADSARSQGDWWITRADHVAEWWSARSTVAMAWTAAGPMPPLAGIRPSGLPDLLVQGPYDADLRSLWIDVVLPVGDTDSVPLVDGAPVDFRSTEWGMQIPIGTLTAGASSRVAFVITEEG